MSAVLVGRFDVGSPEWHAARANGLGGSEIAPVLGLSPFESRFSLWHRKMGLIGPVEQSEIMDAGTRLEPAIARKFLDEHPELSASMAGTYRHSERHWQIANPDLVLVEACDCLVCEHPEKKATALFEAKYALYDDHWGEPGTDEIPVWYRCQVQWYLDVFGLTTCYLMVFIGSQGVFREYVIHADKGEQLLLREAAQTFLHDLKHELRPDVDAHGSTYSAIKELHPEINGDTVDIPLDLARRYQAAKLALKAAKEEDQTATSLVADTLGNGKYAKFNGLTLADRRSKQDGLPYLTASRALSTYDLKEAS